MISFKDSIRELDQKEGLFRASLRCYLAAIHHVESQALEIVPEVGAAYRDAFARLARELPDQPSAEILSRNSATFGRTLEAFAEEARQAHLGQQSQVRAILVTLTDAARLLNVRNDSHSQQLHDFAGNLEEAAKLTDLGEIQRRLRANVTDLKACVDRMCADNRASVADLENEVRDCRKRLAEAEKLVYLDPLTGAGNRREAERQLKLKMDAGRGFCLVIVVLNRYRWIVERHGHACGDELMKLFHRRLQAAMRSDDVACRWGGDEFAVLMDGSLTDAMRRTFQIGPLLRGRYAVALEGKETKIDVGASLGVAEYSKGESLEQLFSRSSQALLRQQSVESVS
jgi:diguanylate cyclase (GGDEF)-like protein